jgi:hypothetical protein
LEHIDDNGERLERISETTKSVFISVVPVLLSQTEKVFKEGIYPKDYYYLAKVINIIKKLVKSSNVKISQHGFMHYCPDCYKKFIDNGRDENAFPDPWHENRCLYNPMKSVDEQASFMEKGKRAIEQVFEVSPKDYIPPTISMMIILKMLQEK